MKSNNNKSIGEGDDVVTHSLRRTVMTLLTEAGTRGSAIMMRTGHRQMESLNII